MPGKNRSGTTKRPPAKRASRRKSPPRRSPLVESNLRLIWKEQRISRAEISRRTGLSRSTVSETVDSLLPTGLIAEVGVGPSSGGRPPVVLEFRDDAFAILGVDMGASHVAVALTDLRGRVLVSRERPHPVRTDPEGTRALIARFCDACLTEWPAGARRLVGIGVAVPSPVDPRHPDRLSEVVLPAWRGGLGLDFLAERYGVPLMVDNDANLAALGERWWGAGRTVDDFAYIKVATGLGLGHVINGRIYRGSTGVAGEIGHMAIDPHGAPCVCGLRGCLATLVGAPALVDRTRALLATHPESGLAGAELTLVSIEDAALAGDALAMTVVREAAEYLGIAVASLLNLTNPAMVILGGGLARLGDLLLQPLRETVRRRTLISSLVACEIRTSELGEQASAVGAATMVLEVALEDSSLFPAARGRGGRR
ncbi:MAG TPA: ROK family transcriptional regulator [Acidobacteriota bacterium]|nr:ROK family transcriptional regulator [Acidobacteriota bacterium]